MTKILALLRGKNIFSFVWMFISVILVVNLINYLFELAGLQLTGWAQFVWTYGLQNLVLLIVLYFWFYRRFPLERKEISWKTGNIWHLIGYVLLLFLSYFSLMVVIFVIKTVLDIDVIPGLGQQISLIEVVGTGFGLWVAFIAAVLIAPVIEEYVFRGWGMLCLPVQTRPYLSILLNSLLFALFHFELSIIIPLVYLGCLLAWVRNRSGSILPGIVFHVINNSLALLVDYSMHLNTR